MTCDEAKERAVIFRAMLSNIVCAEPGPDRDEMMLAAISLLRTYPFDIEALAVVRKIAAKKLVAMAEVLPVEDEATHGCEDCFDTSVKCAKHPPAEPGA